MSSESDSKAARTWEALQVELYGAVRPRRPSGSLNDFEEFWRDHYLWLERCGYRLRPRYSPDWVPSWKTTKKSWDDCEDGQELFMHADAVRISDGAFAHMKMIDQSLHPYEVEIGHFICSEGRKESSDNHCIPIWDVLHVPGDETKTIIVMPLLKKFNSPRFDTFGEVVEFFDQIIEGLKFMHKHHVAHRDCTGQNIMMDATPLYPEPYHPSEPRMKRDWSGKAKHLTRTQRPVRYYHIDFGISRRYEPEECPPLEDPIWGGDKTVPEYHISNEARNPFPVDIYYLGNMIREEFLQKRYGFEFMRPLVEDMVQNDPTKRPTVKEVAARYEIIRKSLSRWKLRSRVVRKDDWAIFGFFRGVAHWTRRVKFIVIRVPAIPTPL